MLVLLKALFGPRKPSEPPDLLTFERIEEYKAVLQNHAAIHARRQSTTNVFVSLNGVFLTAIGFLLVSSHLNSWWVVGAVGVINGAIFPMNLIWLRILNRYQINHLEYIRYLREIETELAKRWGNKHIGIYRRFVDPAVFARVGTSQLERLLAIYFLCLYPAIIVVAGIFVYLVSKQMVPPLFLS